MEYLCRGQFSGRQGTGPDPVPLDGCDVRQVGRGGGEFEEDVCRLDGGIPSMSDPERIAAVADLVAAAANGVVEVVEAGRLEGGDADVHGIVLAARPFPERDLMMSGDDLGEQ